MTLARILVSMKRKGLSDESINTYIEAEKMKALSDTYQQNRVFIYAIVGLVTLLVSLVIFVNIRGTIIDHEYAKSGMIEYYPIHEIRTTSKGNEFKAYASKAYIDSTGYKEYAKLIDKVTSKQIPGE